MAVVNSFHNLFVKPMVTANRLNRVSMQMHANCVTLNGTGKINSVADRYLFDLVNKASCCIKIMRSDLIDWHF
jgi:hypothetical protein